MIFIFQVIILIFLYIFQSWFSIILLLCPKIPTDTVFYSHADNVFFLTDSDSVFGFPPTHQISQIIFNELETPKMPQLTFLNLFDNLLAP
jgi:hypothetical protein